MCPGFLRHSITNPGILCSKLLGCFKVDLVFHPSEVDPMSLTSLNKFLPLYTEVFLRYCKCHKCLMSQRHRWTLSK